MASDQDFVNFVIDQLSSLTDVKAKKMFGEYGIFSEGKMFALICDNRLLMKPTDSGRTFIKNPVEEPPYPGAINCFLIEEQLEDRSWLTELAILTIAELPTPKARKKRKV